MSDVQKIEERLADLKQERDSIISPLGFLIVGRQNLNNSKIVGSFSGNVVFNLIISSARLVALGIDRVWDKQGLYLTELAEQISKLPTESFPLQSPQIFRITGEMESNSKSQSNLEAVRDEALIFYEGALRKRIRIYRTEQLAHSQRGKSKDRKHLGKDLADLSLTLEDIEVAGRQTTAIIDNVVLGATREDLNSNKFLDIEIASVTRFWNTLPNFSQMEFNTE